MDMDGEIFLDKPQKVNIVIKCKLRVHPSLEKNLGSAKFDCLGYLFR